MLVRLISSSLLLAVFSSPALADAIGPPDPTVTCPTGATAETNHCGTVCISRHCATDADCFRAGERCVAVSLCAVDEPYCGGFGAGDYERIYGACAGAPCGTGECREIRTCLSPSAGDAGPPPGVDAGPAEVDAGQPPPSGEDAGIRTDAVLTYGCGCRAGSRANSGLGWAALGLLALWVWRRR